MVQRALNLGEESQSAPISAVPPRPPLTDAEFRMFLDPIGQIVQNRELRRVIYYGGIEPSLRYIYSITLDNFIISVFLCSTFVTSECIFSCF